MVPPSFWVITCFLFGAVIGSFINMLSYRVPRYISLTERSRSFCPSCKAQLAWYENIPLLSYAFLLGRCLHCRKPIGIRYFLIELIVSTLFALAAYQYWGLNSLGLEPPMIFAMQLFLVADMVFLSVCDLELWVIPVQSTLLWIPAGLILAVVFPDLHLSMTTWTGTPWQDALIDSFAGIVLGSGILWCVGFLVISGSFYWFRLRGKDERPIEGMGEGDMHLMALIGALLGWKPALETLAIALFIGCTTGLAKKYWDRIQHKRLGDKWKPWQPTFDLPPDASDAELQPLLWPPLAIGAATIVVAVILNRLTDKVPGNGASEEHKFLIIAMLSLGALQVVAFLFYHYLKKIDRLPKMEVEETADGAKQEVMDAGNYTYMPFGPSLALAAIIVVFFDPLIRSVAYWGFYLLPSASGTRLPGLPRLPFNVLFENTLTNWGVAVMKFINGR